MPIIPFNTKCAMLACNNTKAKLSALCIEHGGRDTYTVKRTDERAEFNGMYNNSKWQKKRALQLSKQPLCQSCLGNGIVKSANHVDHLFSWRAIGHEAFYRNIFQSLCHECHSDKTLLEREGIYRHYNVGSEPYKDYSIDDYGFVLVNQQVTD